MTNVPAKMEYGEKKKMTILRELLQSKEKH